ncbi:hypothetical protein [Nocardioides sp.]|uniref:hypothetical protein n=1 Tax=Nocardioides sp. TaxID=35761 RepID=UPI00271A24BE|nr:hypothetical protein [Nocardioides sp.]MDO9456897.1 hypothetical protein [Nocardioides sp.]
MGDMGLRRRPPRGWLPGTVASAGHAASSHVDPDGGAAVIETSFLLRVTWQVRLPGREPFLVAEERSCPVWVFGNEVGGSGRRWWALRASRTYGLTVGVEMPCAVDPGDLTDVWVDWDAGYDAHEPVWRHRSALDRAMAERRGRFDGLTARLSDPFGARLPAEQQRAVEAEADRRVAQERVDREVQRQQAVEAAEQAQWGGVDPEEKATFQRMASDLVRIDQTGRPASGVIVDVVDTGRVLVGLAVRRLEIEVVEVGDPTPRRVVLELPMQPRIAKRYRAGMAVRLKVDPADPQKVCVLAGRP